MRYAPLLIVALVVLAGCMGGGGSGATPTSTATSAQPGQPAETTTPASECDENLASLIPEPPEGFGRAQDPGQVVVISRRGIQTYRPTNISQTLVGADTAERSVSAYYTGPNDSEYFLSIARWETQQGAMNEAENHSFFFQTAVEGPVRVTASGKNATVMQALVTSVPCIDQDDLIESGFTINITNVSVNESIGLNTSFDNASFDQPDGAGTASISALHTEIVTGEADAVYTQATIEGAVNNTGLRITLAGPDGQRLAQHSIDEANLSDGTETVRLRMDRLGGPSAGKYTVTLSKGMLSEPLRTENLTIRGPVVELTDSTVQTQAKEFSEGYEITNLTLSLTNTGDVPATLRFIEVAVGDQSTQLPLDTTLHSGERTTITDDSSVNLLTLEEGETEMTLTFSGLREPISNTTVTVDVTASE